jgi:hypothetical protein
LEENGGKSEGFESSPIFLHLKSEIFPSINRRHILYYGIRMHKKGGNFGTGEINGDLSIVGDFTTIPVINVAGIYSDKIEDRKAVAEKIRDACTRVGFFYIEGHSIPEEVVDKVFDLGKQFFELDFEEKMKLFINNTPNYRGYTPLFGSGNPSKDGLGSKSSAFLCLNLPLLLFWALVALRP